MQPEDRDAGYLWDMVKHARLAVQLTQNVTFNEYRRDRVMQLALERIVEIIGEAARRVSNSFRDAHPEIPWQKIVGQRNVLAHEYDRILHDILWTTATVDAPVLVTSLEPLLPTPRDVPDDKL